MTFAKLKLLCTTCILDSSLASRFNSLEDYLPITRFLRNIARSKGKNLTIKKADFCGHFF